MRVFIFLCLALPALCDQVGQTIVDGTNADIANYPHQLSHRVSGSHSCGASIISSTRTVTAAHCIGGVVSTYTLLGGTSDRTVTNCVTCELWSPNSVVRHPDYSDVGAVGYPNDCGVFKHNAVTFNSNFQPIAMATTANGDFAGDSCVITGWGRTCGSCSIPDILQMATMTVLTNANCAVQWSNTQINVGHICVQDATSSSCSGDSGGPLVCSGVLAGATSWGQSNCLPTFPSVYTRISYFYNWIVAQ